MTVGNDQLATSVPMAVESARHCEGGSRTGPRLLSVVSSCYNEEGNLQEFYDRTTAVLARFPDYSYEIIMADNCSTDGSREILRSIAARDSRFKVIINASNVGPDRSSYNALMHASGDACIPMSSDLQDPPEVIAKFIEEWEKGNLAVLGVRTGNPDRSVLSLSRSLFYGILARISDSDAIVRNFTGFGLYDRRFVDAMKLYKQPIPYIRGLVGKIGFQRAEVEFIQPPRTRGRSTHSFFSLYGVAMTGFVSHSKLPLRLATFTGFWIALGSLLVALGYFVYKLLFWNSFSVGLAPLVIGLFFFSAVQLIFIGIIGEYVGAILTQVKNEPLAIEDEKINFDSRAGPAAGAGSPAQS
jgi:glycosyltransferase involved in cell wall biosynthesis